jgi:WD repeat-containing protein 68
MYAMAIGGRADQPFRLAVGSCVEQEGTNNHIQIIDQDPDGKLEFYAEVDHPFPVTKLMWAPSGSKHDYLASSSTTLNLWKVEEGQVKHTLKLSNTRQQNSSVPPITSFDWSRTNPAKLAASSVDTTCTIWNIEKQRIETQLIAHDKAVYDVAFSQVDSLFASVGADGSVRLFDQRNLDHSTIIYEASPPSPLLRLAWNSMNTNHIATIAMDTTGVILIDIRKPSFALASLSYHESCVNGISWAPHSSQHLLCGTADGVVLVWDVVESSVQSKSDSAPPGAPRPAPLLAYQCGHEVYQVQWPVFQPDHVAIGMANRVEVLQV